MAAEILVTLVVEVIGGMLAHAGAEAVGAKGRAWFDRRELEKLDDDAKQAFIAGLVFVASYDGALSPAELDEIDERLRKLEVQENGREVALALAAREEVAVAIAGDSTDYASRLVARIPEGRAREALLRVSIAVASKGDLSRQIIGVRMLGKAMGLSEEDIERTVADETQRLIR